MCDAHNKKTTAKKEFSGFLHRPWVTSQSCWLWESLKRNGLGFSSQLPFLLISSPSGLIVTNKPKILPNRLTPTAPQRQNVRQHSSGAVCVLEHLLKGNESLPRQRSQLKSQTRVQQNTEAHTSSLNYSQPWVLLRYGFRQRRLRPLFTGLWWRDPTVKRTWTQTKMECCVHWEQHQMLSAGQKHRFPLHLQVCGMENHSDFNIYFRLYN